MDGVVACSMSTGPLTKRRSSCRLTCLVIYGSGLTTVGMYQLVDNNILAINHIDLGFSTFLPKYLHVC
jgi:hypothetical protein